MERVNEGSRQVAKAAVMLSMTDSRQEEMELRQQLMKQDLLTAAVDYGGEFVLSIMKIVEKAVVAAKREKLIGETDQEEGAVAGAAREAMAQVTNKALGLSVGGKIAIARKGSHVSVAVFFGIGLAHLNEICVGMGHRAI